MLTLLGVGLAVWLYRIPSVHFHCCVIRGVLAAGVDGQIQFAEVAVLTPADCAAVQQQVRRRV